MIRSFAVAFALCALSAHATSKVRSCPSADECQKKCDGGDLTACAERGAFHGYAQKGKMTALFIKACNGGAMRGCAYLSEIRLDGGIIGDAFTLAKKSCEGKDAYGCFVLGNIYEGGRGIGRDPKKQRDAYEKGCEGGEPAACMTLSSLDKARAKEWREKACAVGGAAECTQLAGEARAAKDSSRTAEFAKKGCDAGDDLGCALLGELTASGEGVSKDYAKAAPLLARGCRKSAKSCGRWRDLLDKPCKAGEAGACDAAKALNEAIVAKK
jgi:TPR repeat protein